MSNEKRSLSDALKLTPEIEQFITGILAQESPVAGKPAEPASSKKAAKRTKPPTKKPSTNRKRKPSLTVSLGKQLNQARVANTTRLRPEVATALQRFSLERKLRGESPHSQQEIIELALAAWLKTQRTPRSESIESEAQNDMLKLEQEEETRESP